MIYNSICSSIFQLQSCFTIFTKENKLLQLLVVLLKIYLTWSICFVSKTIITQENNKEAYDTSPTDTLKLFTHWKSEVV